MRVALTETLALVVFFAGYATAQPQFLTGQEFMAYPGAMRLTYSAGFNHGLAVG
ncbi:MAG TPA: hypothetical protein VFM35_08035 [Candidatus Binatia bacterium]|nr:hypothetical protein [Candidatus Binatia bacterium]